MDTAETREVLIKKAEKIGISESLLRNLTSRSIRKIVEYDKEVKKGKNATREIPGHRT